MNNHDLTKYVYKKASAFDTETHMMAMGNVIPKLVCMAVTIPMPQAPGIASDVQSVHPSSYETLLDNVSYLLDVSERQNEVIVGANVAFDLAVICREFPAALPVVFDLLEKGLIEDIQHREKFLHLTLHGDLDFHRIEGENEIVVRKLEYNLAALSKYYLGKNRGGEKEENDAWRKFFSELEHEPVSAWPEAAVKYVIEDSEDTWMIREFQEKLRIECWQKLGVDPFAAQAHRVKVAFAMQLMSAWGVAIDANEKRRIDAELAEALKPEKMKKLIEAGVLIPGRPAYEKPLKKGGVKIIKAVEDKISQTRLREIVKEWCEANGREVAMTAPSGRNPEGQVSIAMEFFEENHRYHPIFMEYYERQKLQKMVSTEMPRLTLPDGTPAPVIHPSYDVLKVTGRISSFASSLYPSANITNVDPRARGCYVPRPDFLIASIDYNQMELVTAAQTCYRLFGQSVLRDKINAGIDAHTYLGAQIAYHMEPDFKKTVDASGQKVDADVIFNLFAACKKHPSKEMQDFFAKYRKFAKPVGLGYPGGLGPKTMIDFAWAGYQLEIDLKTAETLRDIWRSTFPEFVLYFKHLSVGNRDLVDPDKYAYMSPMGMYRAGCDYCAVANGQALQTPGAEGATLGNFNLIRACYDPTLSSILSDDEQGPRVRPIAFIHDENLVEIREGDGSFEARKLRHDQCRMIAQIMVDAMRVITPDVVVKANPVLMRRWNKFADPVFDKDGFLDVWTPKAK